MEERLQISDVLEKSINNYVEFTGEIIDKIRFDHKSYKENFFYTRVAAKRLSGVCDNIPIMIPECLLKEGLDVGKRVRGKGHFESCNIRKYDEKGNPLLSSYLKLFVFAIELEVIEDEAEYAKIIVDENIIWLDGFLCKEPVYRKTGGQPDGKDIADLMIAVNRPSKRADYLPSITWKRNALFARYLEVGDRIQCLGRIQSRTYTKLQNEAEEPVEKEVYEVSIFKLERVKMD